ncbi:hypothetical protein C0Q64_18860 [Streptomyces albidoflavus]|uniref:hypothetical protein n=1 Tax=Streptomyces albidoflavus TaxID=1886 RepID=UPI00101E2FD9|nr:hypothetical protein [Streptomyces albidoflavus]RZD96940.1 hypothetical protein C0Q64_18860 [Streptomyces albidoflavus]RZD99618.1 hypothetical protein C0Q65_19110 [Streptomyces albidoflavus]
MNPLSQPPNPSNPPRTVNTVNALNAVGTPAPANPALFGHLEWKAEQILGQLRAGYSLERLSAVYEVPEAHLRDRVPEWRRKYPGLEEGPAPVSRSGP